MDDRPPCPFTPGHCREYFDQVTRVSERLDGLREAVASSRADLKDRLERMNEIREQLDRQARTFATITEVDLRFAAVSQQVSGLRDMVTAVRGDMRERQGSHPWVFAILTAMIAAVVAAVVGFLVP